MSYLCDLLTLLRTKFRKDANAADNKGATVAVDSLINYEAVKVCLSSLNSTYTTTGVQQREIRSRTVRRYSADIREGLGEDRY